MRFVFTSSVAAPRPRDNASDVIRIRRSMTPLSLRCVGERARSETPPATEARRTRRVGSLPEPGGLIAPQLARRRRRGPELRRERFAVTRQQAGVVADA